MARTHEMRNLLSIWLLLTLTTTTADMKNSEFGVNFPIWTVGSNTGAVAVVQMLGVTYCRICINCACLHIL